MPDCDRGVPKWKIDRYQRFGHELFLKPDYIPSRITTQAAGSSPVVPAIPFKDLDEKNGYPCPIRSICFLIAILCNLKRRRQSNWLILPSDIRYTSRWLSRSHTCSFYRIRTCYCWKRLFQWRRWRFFGPCDELREARIGAQRAEVGVLGQIVVEVRLWRCIEAAGKV